MVVTNFELNPLHSSVHEHLKNKIHFLSNCLACINRNFLAYSKYDQSTSHLKCIIWIKHDYLLGPEGDVVTSGLGLTVPRVLANVLENMFVPYSCINAWKLWRKNLEKLKFLYFNNGALKHERCVGFKNSTSRAKTYIILTSLSYAHFCACYG